MTKKTRYLLLLIGFIAFLILAPLIVFYVRGITYDFNKKVFVKTGILAIRMEPKEADVYLNNKLTRQNSGDIKFIVPGEYEVTIKKEGYFSWNKRLNILSGQVTWASPAFNKIYLLLQDPPIKQLAEKIKDFYGQNDKIVYLSNDNLSFALVNNPESIKNYQSPSGLDSILAADASLNNLILTGTGATSTKIYLFNKPLEKFYDLSELFKTPTEFNFQDNELFALNENTLFTIDLNKKTKIAIFSNVLAFNFQDNRLYFIQKNPQEEPLIYISEKPFSSSQKLLNGLPNFSFIKIFVTYEKQIFLLADNTLYLANSSMEKLAENVDYLNFQPLDSALALVTPDKQIIFDPFSKNLNYNTRTSEKLKNLIVKGNIGKAFYIADGNIKSSELDTRDKQNQNILYFGQSEKFFIDSATKNITLLDNGILKQITIR